MPDDIEPVLDHVRRRMSNTHGRDTAPELALRRRLHAMGYRYRVNARPEPGLRRTADLLFTRARVAVFVDGCFWHMCPEHFVWPRTRADFWRTKIEGNVTRDRATTQALQDAGWTVVRLWEHTPIDQAVATVRAAVDHTRIRPRPDPASQTPRGTTGSENPAGRDNSPSASTSQG